MIRFALKKVVDGIISLECRYFTKQKKTTQKQLLIFRKDGLGDFIIFYPFLKHYRHHFQDYLITIVIPKVAADLRPLLKDSDEIVEFDARSFSRNFFYRRRFIRELVRSNFDTVIYPVYSREPVGDLIVKLTRARERIAFARSDNGNKAYTRVIYITPEIEKEIERNAEFTRQVTGEDVQIHFPTIDIRAFPHQRSQDLQKFRQLQPNHYAVIFIGAAARYRVWPEERFAQICDHLIKKGITPVICGGKSDSIVATRVLSHLQEPNKAYNLAGKTSLGSLAHILAGARLYFGNETGALHLAVALNTPTVCLLGGGVFGRFFPYGDSLRHRYAYDHNMTCQGDNWACATKCRGDEHAPCIMGISVANAKKVLEGLLEYLGQ